MFALLLPLLAVATAITLAFYALEEKPLVSRVAVVDSATVAAGKALVKRIKRQIESADERGAVLWITGEELSQLAQMGSHTFEGLNSDVYLDAKSINSSLSLHLPPNPFGEYLNLGVRIGQSSEGINIDRLSLGPLDFSRRWPLSWAAGLADIVMRDEQAGLLLASVRGLQIEGDTVRLTILPPPDVKAKLKQAVRTLQASRLPQGEGERVVHYYDLLVSFAARGDRGSQSLSAYLAPVMEEASRRGGRHGAAVAENRAAMLALAIYFSNGAFEMLVGKVVSGQRELVRPPSGITLGGRQDLAAHFLYSAGITLATQQGIGVAAGEFKELLDSENGGSGFSFVDLAADRAGIEFVTVATASESAARQLQQRVASHPVESVFFPVTKELDERLDEKQFRLRYGNIESERFLRQLDLIDQRIDALPLYQ